MRQAFPSGTCDRCHCKTQITTMSMFNTEEICLGCKEKEKKHPKYAEAVKADREAIARGNYNFPGIGKPSNL